MSLQVLVVEVVVGAGKQSQPVETRDTTELQAEAKVGMAPWKMPPPVKEAQKAAAPAGPALKARPQLSPQPFAATVDRRGRRPGRPTAGRRAWCVLLGII